ncbi:MAG: hypothetical protein BWK78_04390 [Thiotrichaceae bacterium IS1]|nr:MAG: hypothetical protein BWK78_04390 [Thiotrichaceae bacterium IS1]
MKSLSGKHLCKLLESYGWKLQRVRGSHHIYAHPDSTAILTVPVPGQKDLKKGILHQLLKEAGLTKLDW